tara:strand:+ start:2318 stop:4738 length:2421 start_codon:yes stop_codon:yes gene_type:complete
MLDQNQLNEEMTALGISRYNNQIESAREQKETGRTKAGQTLIRELLPAFATAIKGISYKNKTKHNRWMRELKEYDPKKAAFLVLKTTLDTFPQKHCTYTSMSYSVGKAVEFELRLKHLLKTNEKKGSGIILGAKRRAKASQFRHIQLSMRHEEEKEGIPDFEPWSRRDRIMCGMTLIELLRASTGLIEYSYIREKGRKAHTRFVTPSPVTLEWMENFNNYRALMEPFWLPSLDLPADWTSVWEGGYRAEGTQLPEVTLIKTRDKDFLRSLKTADLSEPIRAINLIQRTPWQINNKVLDLATWAWDNNIPIGSTMVPQEDEVKPPFPVDGDENKASRDTWAKMASGVHRRNNSSRSKRVLCAKIIGLAERFRGYRFFAPQNFDFRGRAYPINSFLHTQGPDLCRGLLEFYRDVRVKGKEEAKWLAIHGANTWGFDKVTLDERVKWTYDNTEWICKIATDPTSFTEWIDADSPWQFIAFCFEWKTFADSGFERLRTRIPINVDATNNGLQILSILTRCEYGCKATNVIPTGGVADIYNVARVRAEASMKKDARENHPFAQAWLDYGINRDTLKRPCMTWSYGLTMYSCRQYILDWFEKKIHADDCPSPFCDKEFYKAVHYLSVVVWNAIEEVLDLPKQCMEWLQKVSKILSKNKRHIQWVTPSGFVVKQDYRKIKTSRVTTNISGEALWVRFGESMEEISPIKQSQGVSPNLVHSLDGTLLHKTVNSANDKGIYDFSMIHDSYGTHCKNIPILNEVIRDEAVKMFSEDYLRDWLSQIKKQNPDLEFPEPPEYGSADISQIRDSPYFFS